MKPKTDALRGLLETVSLGLRLSDEAPEVARRADAELDVLEAKVADLLTALNEESVRKNEAKAARDAATKKLEEVAKMVQDLLPQVEVLRASHLQCEAERDNWKFLQEETSKSRAEWQSRAEKAEAQLSECLAATNEVLQEALAAGREAEDGPNRALVQAVRAAARLGAEEMNRKARDMVRGVEMNGTTKANLLAGLAAIPLPGDEVKT